MAFLFYIALAFIATCNAEQISNLASANSPAYVCKSKNGYYNIAGSCDSYIQCDNYVAVKHTCPDGLHFNQAAKYPYYPCGYPADVPCAGLGAVRAAQATVECPHQYGYFPSPNASPDSCGYYRICIEGRALEMHCPTGLAFNPDTSRCDWPHLVPSCKANEYLGFSCPAEDDDDKIKNFKYPGNCFYFFSCQNGRARLLSCDEGSAFDTASGHCIDEDLVNCAKQ